ncbi:MULTISPECIES: hypothetical protein [Vagococcus]|uniref:Uncharacterized protein n=1 Tax=Vagococcus fluvialis bH819 TaxID=1255619 RepID=A0A1X6WS80_9ENTE|nr:MULTISPECIES: hypothetical protein [Vagococcus]SLM87092.1 hypothetical protein FM121_13420 [Vagococcus fluvialis bH819]
MDDNLNKIMWAIGILGLVGGIILVAGKAFPELTTMVVDVVKSKLTNGFN